MTTTRTRTGVGEARDDFADLADPAKILVRQAVLEVRTNAVGVVVASAAQPLGYDPATQKASLLVQSLGVTRSPDIATGPGSVDVSAPVLLQNVPVAWPRSGGAYMTFPLAIGDSGELAIQDRSLALWMLSGAPVDPGFNWTHALQDAVFRPGLHSDVNPITPPTDQTAAVLEGPLIKLGRAAVEPAVLGQQLTVLLKAIVAAGTPVPGDGGAAVKAAQIAVVEAGVASIVSGKVKIQ
jgi:hypothetical protein